MTALAAGSPRAPGAALFLPLSLRTRHDRRDRLAGDPGRRRGPDPPRPGRRRSGRRRRVPLQEEPPRDAPIDAIVPRALERLGEALTVEEFVPFGYDERQYDSPGFDLPVGSLTRTPWGRYPEYHTSADDLDFIRPEHLERSLAVYRAVVDELERREIYVNLAPNGEPMLGRRGLYRAIGGDDAGRERELALLWVLNLSDGEPRPRHHRHAQRPADARHPRRRRRAPRSPPPRARALAGATRDRDKTSLFKTRGPSARGSVAPACRMPCPPKDKDVQLRGGGGEPVVACSPHPAGRGSRSETKTFSYGGGAASFVACSARPAGRSVRSETKTFSYRGGGAPLLACAPRLAGRGT